MGLKARIYSVLVVSSSENFNKNVSPLLPDYDYQPVTFVPSLSKAERALSERDFDYVIINSPLPDGSGTEFAVDTSNRQSVVLLLVRSDLHDEVFDLVAEHGVFTIAKPIAKANFLTALGWMSSARERLRKSEMHTLSIQEKMEEIRLVNRAKWLLISELKMSEQEAHRYIEKQAMDRCVTRREVAKGIIAMYS